MVASSIQVFTHEKYIFGTGEKAASAGLALQSVDYRIWFFFIILRHMGVLNLLFSDVFKGLLSIGPSPCLGFIWIFDDRKKSFSLPVNFETSCLYTMY
jgi:hypothetical protein